MQPNELPVVVIGAGPVGLAAAAHLRERGLSPLVLEAGDRVAANMAAWGHVRLFSPWRYVVDAASERLLAAHGWSAPEGERFPTGSELIERYLEPLAATPELAPGIRLGARVTGVARQEMDLMKTPGREAAPFLVRVATAAGEEEVLARAVIDASGTWQSPNPLGASGLPALGEAAARARINYGIPEVLGRERERYAGKRVLVLGSGHSAFNTLLDLAELMRTAPATSIVWAIRREAPGALFGGGAKDQLPERGRLGQLVKELLASGRLALASGFRASRVQVSATGVTVASAERELPEVDEVIVATGFRPDLSLTRELRLSLDAGTEAPARLAPLIDPNLHSCGTVPPHGADELAHAEPGFFTVGMKSYGRAPTFLLLTGYEQVRSVAAALAGDWEAARRVELVLPETGVCSSDIEAGGCACGTAQAPAQGLTAVVSCCGSTAPCCG